MTTKFSIVRHKGDAAVTKATVTGASVSGAHARWRPTARPPRRGAFYETSSETALLAATVRASNAVTGKTVVGSRAPSYDDV